MSKKKPTFLMRCAGRLLGWYIWFAHVTSRKEVIGREHPERCFKEGQTFIISAWHNRNLQSPMAFQMIRPKNRKLCVIASESRDGELAAQALAAVGVESARGSSTRGGAKALFSMVKLIKKGYDLGITPDGPKGPLFEIQSGVLALAKLGGSVILPLAWDGKPKKQLRSWDRLYVPLPFSKLRFVWGRPIAVSKDADDVALEQLRSELKQEMDRIEKVTSFEANP